MSASSCVIGKIVGVYGVKGWVKIKPFTEDAASILSYQPWRLVPNGAAAGGVRTGVAVEAHAFRPKGLIVKFDGLDDRDEAALLNGWRIEVDADLLPELESNEYYWRDLIGLTVISTWQDQTAVLGKVTGLLETGANDVLVVKGQHGADDRERLVPFVMDQYVKEVNIAAGELRVEWDPDF